MQVQIIQLIIAMVLFFILFFGVSFILNMILKMTWLMMFVYPIVLILVVNTTPLYDVFTQFPDAFNAFITNVMNLTFADYVLFISGFLGIIVAGLAIKYLRNAGYTMF